MKIDIRDVPVYYINMDYATEQRSYMDNILDDCGFKNVTRFSGIVGTNSSAKDSAHAEGCAASHLHLMQKCKPPFLILEDDCAIKNFRPVIELPDDADAAYLGISSWGRLDGRSGPFIHFSKVTDKLVRIFNMLSTHAMLFLSEQYCSMCTRVAEHWMRVADHIDIGYAEIHKYFNVYAFDDPIFRQRSSEDWDPDPTCGPLTSYLHRESSNVPSLCSAYGLNSDQGQYLLNHMSSTA